MQAAAFKGERRDTGGWAGWHCDESEPDDDSDDDNESEPADDSDDDVDDEPDDDEDDSDDEDDDEDEDEDGFVSDDDIDLNDRADLEGGSMETLCKSVLENSATVQQLVAAHREALNTIGRDVTVTLARFTCLGLQLRHTLLQLWHV
jgi:hypothetical protein